ncbi:MAG TPA: ABC transporter permease, partial [Burkholderiales bacterium]|nr:ABC transporter permease [Burkholderiales bacterium]
MPTARTERFIAAGTVAAVLAAWWLLTATQVIPPTRFASPQEVWAALRQVALTGYADARLHQHILQSAKLVLMGF